MEATLETLVGCPAIIAAAGSGCIELIYSADASGDTKGFHTVKLSANAFAERGIAPQKFAFVRYFPAKKNLERYEPRGNEGQCVHALWNYVDSD